MRNLFDHWVRQIFQFIDFWIFLTTGCIIDKHIPKIYEGDTAR